MDISIHSVVHARKSELDQARLKYILDYNHRSYAVDVEVVEAEAHHPHQTRQRIQVPNSCMDAAGAAAVSDMSPEYHILEPMSTKGTKEDAKRRGLRMEAHRESGDETAVLSADYLERACSSR